MSSLLQAAGFTPVEVPLVEIIPASEAAKTLAGLDESEFTGLFFSSPNGIRHFHSALAPRAWKNWIRKPCHLVGGKSRPMWESLGGSIAFIPNEASLEGFLREYSNTPGMEEHWAHPCSSQTGADPEDFLRIGVRLRNIPVYRPAMPPDVQENMERVAGEIRALIFCSGSAVDHFFRSGSRLCESVRGESRGIHIVSIGPSTSRTLSGLGITKYIQAPKADNEGLVEALQTLFF